MAVQSQTHIDIDELTDVILRPPEQAGEKALLINTLNHEHQYAITFRTLADLDRTIAELQTLRLVATRHLNPVA